MVVHQYPKFGGSSPSQMETFSISKPPTLSQKHPFVSRKCYSRQCKICRVHDESTGADDRWIVIALWWIMNIFIHIDACICKLIFLSLLTTLFLHLMFLSVVCCARSHVSYSQRYHDDVIKWKHFPRYWPFVRGIHRSPVNSPDKGQWRGALMFSLICAEKTVK